MGIDRAPAGSPSAAASAADRADAPEPQLRAALRDALAARSWPGDAAPGPARIDELANGAPEAWLRSEPAAVLAADLALLATPLGPSELRVRSEPLDPPGPSSRWRLSVAVADRPGLLATTAAVAAVHGLSILQARAATWVALGLALQRVDVVPVGRHLTGEPDWVEVGQALRGAFSGSAIPAARFHPGGPAIATIDALPGPQGAPTRWEVAVSAPDAVGLLAVTARWLSDQGANIEAAVVRSFDGRAVDRFVVGCAAPLDARAGELAAALSAS